MTTLSSSCNASTLYSESTSILSFPISEFSTSDPLVQKIKKLWSIIIEGELLKFNQQSCLRILQRIYSIHLSVEEIRDNISHGIYRQDNLYDFEEIIENLNDLLRQIETFIDYNKTQWIIRRLLNSTYINYQFDSWRVQVKGILEDFAYHYAKYSPNRNFDNILNAWKEQDQTDSINDEQSLIENLAKTWQELLKASKDSHGVTVQQQRVLSILEINRSNIKEVITGLQRFIFNPESKQERITHSFAKTTLEIIQIMFRYRIKSFPWAVTSWEIVDAQNDANSKSDEFTDNCSIFDQCRLAFFRKHIPVTIRNVQKSALKADFINNLIIWSNMDHKNILPLLGANVVVPQPYIINPFLSNGNMIGYLNENPHKALNILNEVTDAMIYLHSNNIIHGDLKGSNVLIDEDGTVKITNFGFYCIPYIRSTLNFSPKTYPWSAPELVGDALPTTQSDVYAFGILAYEAYFEGETYDKSYIDFLLSHLPQNISSAPKEIWELMQECWQTEPDVRPSFDKIKNNISHLLSEVRSCTSIESVDNSVVEEQKEIIISNIQAITTTSYTGTLDNGDNVFVKNYPWICLQQRKTRNTNNTLKSKIAKELQNLQKLEHTSILPVKEYKINDGYFSTISSYVPTGNLISYINKNEVDLIQRVNFIKDICEGLTYLHQHGIVHGDLKGNHILIDENGQIKITGYGIAQIQSNVNKNFLLKSNNSVVINYNCWTAPELFLRNSVPTIESDVYSFGMLCYEILSGSNPFEYRDIRELKENVCIYKIRPLRTKLTINCPDWLWNIINDCWNTEYKERKSLNEIMKILNNPPSMEDSNNDTLLQFYNMKRSQSFINKSLKVNALMNKLHKYKTLSTKISESPEEEITETKNNQSKPLSEVDQNAIQDKRSVSEASVSTLNSVELENYIQSIRNNSVTALLSDTDLTTLKLKSEDDVDEFTKAEIEKLKKRNRRSLSKRLSLRRSSSNLFNVNIFSNSSSPECNGKSFIISADGETSKHKHRSKSSTMKKWSLSAEHFLSSARKTFRKDSSNQKPRMEVIKELPIVEVPSTGHKESVIDSSKPEQTIVDSKIEIIKPIEDIADNTETQTITNNQEESTEITEMELTVKEATVKKVNEKEVTEKEVTEKETSATSISIDNNLPNSIIKITDEKLTKSYPSPESSIHEV